MQTPIMTLTAGDLAILTGTHLHITIPGERADEDRVTFVYAQLLGYDEKERLVEFRTRAGQVVKDRLLRAEVPAPIEIHAG